MGDKINFSGPDHIWPRLCFSSFSENCLMSDTEITCTDNYLDVTGKTEIEHPANLETALANFKMWFKPYNG